MHDIMHTARFCNNSIIPIIKPQVNTEKMQMW